MAEPVQTKRMTYEEFCDWEQTQVERHELVDGVPQLKFVDWDGPKMMVGATNRHNMIVGNIFSILKTRLRGDRCRPYAADGKVKIPKGNIRYPDVTIDCGSYAPEASALDSPHVVIEVLSRSTRWVDQNKKLIEYQTVPGIKMILLLLQDEKRAHLWTPGPTAWEMQELTDPGAIIAIPATSASFTLAEAYEDAL